MNAVFPVRPEPRRVPVQSRCSVNENRVLSFANEEAL